ncbi:MAG: hypothetical protein ACR2LC_09570 [Pyrinomonadaceae bacterium]
MSIRTSRTLALPFQAQAEAIAGAARAAFRLRVHLRDISSTVTAADTIVVVSFAAARHAPLRLF